MAIAAHLCRQSPGESDTDLGLANGTRVGPVFKESRDESRSILWWPGSTYSRC
jgi:hypothetical protein